MVVDTEVNCIPGQHSFPRTSQETGEPLGRCSGCGRTVPEAESYDETCACECGEPDDEDGTCLNCSTKTGDCDEDGSCGRHVRQWIEENKWIGRYAVADARRDIENAGREHLLNADDWLEHHGW